VSRLAESNSIPNKPEMNDNQYHMSKNDYRKNSRFSGRGGCLSSVGDALRVLNPLTGDIPGAGERPPVLFARMTPALRGGFPSSGERGGPPSWSPAMRSRASTGIFSVVFDRPRPVAPRAMGGSIGSFPAA
jgi:hypothetical protein